MPFLLFYHLSIYNSDYIVFYSDLHLQGNLDFLGAGNMYPGGIGSLAPNSVQNANIRHQGNQSVTNGMQQIITPKGYTNHHGAIIQATGNNKNMLDNMIKKQSINSGRVRG
jgi:hypothetical protein